MNVFRNDRLFRQDDIYSLSPDQKTSQLVAKSLLDDAASFHGVRCHVAGVSSEDLYKYASKVDRHWRRRNFVIIPASLSARTAPAPVFYAPLSVIADGT